MKTLNSIAALLIFATFVSVAAQDIGFERSRHKAMLYAIKTDVQKNYFDPALKNIDIEAKYKEALQNMENATSIGQLSSAIAQFLLEFDDSHLYFLPPPKVNSVDYGFGYRMVGDKECRVIWVAKGSDAEKKGLQPGDDIRSVSTFGVTRDSIWKTRYFFYTLFPQPSLTLDVVKPSGTVAEYSIVPKITTGQKIVQPDVNQAIRDSEKYMKEETRQYTYDRLPGAYIWKMPAFSIDRYKVDDIMKDARKFPAMVIDLRGNPGGSVDTALRLIGNFFEADVKVGDSHRRKGQKEVIAKSKGQDAFRGKLAVLVDSDSASAAEVFARVIQLEKRGTIVGDRTAGAVMESELFDHRWGTETITPYAVSVTVADLIMKDGKSLEKVGVTPDLVVLPAQLDMATKRDPAMSNALKLLGIDLSPEAAGSIFKDVATRDQ